MGRIIETLTIKNVVDVIQARQGLIPPDRIRTVVVEALVDTGATMVSISPGDVDALGLAYNRTILVRTGNGRVLRRAYDGALVELLGRAANVQVIKNDAGTPALIGCVLLEMLDLAVDPANQRVIPNPANGGEWTVDMLMADVA